eukprot:TRINITY_DN13657_c0_g1_i2.p1 TRINITY_DN13657_c0_g1~~TRINITY_DN13657_c0_g1_i2.p1  ORF type:complete len:258 (-),score=18.69 TRINITY_DN13657_c0_g1_i2:29-802(-)
MSHSLFLYFTIFVFFFHSYSCQSGWLTWISVSPDGSQQLLQQSNVVVPSITTLANLTSLGLGQIQAVTINLNRVATMVIGSSNSYKIVQYNISSTSIISQSSPYDYSNLIDIQYDTSSQRLLGILQHHRDFPDLNTLELIAMDISSGTYKSLVSYSTTSTRFFSSTYDSSTGSYYLVFTGQDDAWKLIIFSTASSTVKSINSIYGWSSIAYHFVNKTILGIEWRLSASSNQLVQLDPVSGSTQVFGNPVNNLSLIHI